MHCYLIRQGTQPRGYIYDQKVQFNTPLSIMLYFFRFLTFSQEKQLWSEVEAISDALQSDSNDANTNFLKGLYVDSSVMSTVLYY